MEQTLGHTSLFRRPPPILAASASAVFVGSVCLPLAEGGCARSCPACRRAGHFLLPQCAPRASSMKASSGSRIVVIAVILTAIILRSRLDALTRWMCFTFFALVTTCGFARLIRGGLFLAAPHWMMHDLLILAAFSSITSAMGITWVIRRAQDGASAYGRILRQHQRCATPSPSCLRCIASSVISAARSARRRTA